ncbi:LysR family transcriptional regulator [Vibrio orientalis CIP 102891 = ATCC 33934]|uniref:LysR family transcriptional regulator n=1 Tax=Vibrio orientalis CIP 102891 = ATCC 33934 TaxID=675816 RepID=C9QLU9_VIBOR|nr:LysR family transcriptional regulator [Vibrio orientalis]EEX92876.1 regulatory protein LysR:LysR substrate-binding [Vibrio orientalis CIP 102891 = ATCC 33934]EGU46557.1 LysR family transcriptional regulator [Vibrio orientalis CIP 102891 = ATCC 33934]
MNMNIKLIVKHDQNLIITLYLLLKYKHVSRVADEIFVSQSAVSQQLNKLRRIFNDKLLVRTNNKMMLTPLSDKIFPQLENIFNSTFQIYNQLEGITQPTKEQYRICMIDGAMTNNSASVLASISEKYEKKVKFEILGRYDGCVEDLNQGKLDFLVGNFSGLSNNIHQLKIGNYSYSIYVRKNHPLNKNEAPINIKETYSYGYIQFVYHGELIREFNRNVDRNEINQNTVLNFSQYSSIIDYLQETDYVSLLPDVVAARSDLIKLNIIEELTSGNSYLYWHSLMEHDPFHRYLRARLFEHSNNISHQKM